jgi:hypothetical protein
VLVGREKGIQSSRCGKNLDSSSGIPSPLAYQIEVGAVLPKCKSRKIPNASSWWRCFPKPHRNPHRYRVYLGETDALDGHLLPGLQPLGVPRELRGTSAPFRYNDLVSFDAAMSRMGGNVAAVVMEPFRSQLPHDDFVGKVAARCRAAGAVFIVDEVTSGLRYGFPGACATLGEVRIMYADST